MTADVGARVRATRAEPAGPGDVDQRGEIVRAEEGTLFGLPTRTPVVRLDDGREWRGWECWWTEEDGGPWVPARTGPARVGRLR